MISSILKLLKGSITDIIGGIIFASSFALAYFTNISTVVLVVAYALLGVIISRIKRLKGDKNE